jgi:hypothetical protein
MKRFMALYVGAPDAFEKWNALDENIRKEREAKGMQAWGAWMEKHKAVIVDAGGPLGKTKRTDANGISDIRNPIGGYVIVEAETHDDAAKLFEKHPHFAILPGDAVEIMPCNAIPTI